MLILDEKSFKTTVWSGGKTTELYIYPENSTFRERNFTFRLSTATVEVEASDFTPFAGVERHLMILSGEMTLAHEGQHSIHLKKGEQDHFFGDWKTKSIGKCVDFNLMLRKGKGQLKSIFLDQNESMHFSESNTTFQAFFLVEGNCDFTSSSQKNIVASQLVISNEAIEIKAVESCFLVQIVVEF